MRTRRRWLRVLLLAVALAVVAFGLYVYTRLEPRGSQRVVYTPAARTCETAPEGFTFCVFRAAQGTDGRVVYHLHGRNLDATAWNDDTYYTSMIQARWAELGRTPPVVVGVSFGNLWLLAEKNPAPRSGLLEVFRDRVLPAVEARIGPPRARVLLGESMGGINALAAGLALPGTFTRVVSLCPTLFETSPFADDAAVEAALEATGADPKRVLALRHIADEYFADEAAWRAFSPNERVRPPASAPRERPRLLRLGRALRRLWQLRRRPRVRPGRPLGRSPCDVATPLRRPLRGGRRLGGFGAAGGLTPFRPHSTMEFTLMQ